MPTARATGRTTKTAIWYINSAIQNPGKTFTITDHTGIPEVSKSLARQIRVMLEQLNLTGFDVSYTTIKYNQPHQEFIKMYEAGKRLEVYRYNRWEDCNPVEQTFNPTQKFRVKHIPQYQIDLTNAIKAGKEVEWNGPSGWCKAEALHYHVENNTQKYRWEDEKDYRIALDAWQLDLVKAINEGKLVEYRDSDGYWQPANTLHRNVKDSTAYEYIWRVKQDYRVKEPNLYAWAYYANGEWYIASKLLSETRAQKYLATTPGVEKIKKLSRIL